MKEDLSNYLPWYLNGSLDEEQAQEVAEWLASSEQARHELEMARVLYQEVRRLPELELPANVLPRLQQQVAGLKKLPGLARRSVQTAWSLILAALFLALLWLSVRPGVALEWTVETGEPVGFLIYRAPQGSTEYKLVEELSAVPGTKHYRYVDTRLLPGVAYTYQVEGIGAGGPPVVRRSISIDPLAVLPGQLAVLFTSLALGFSLVLLAQALQINAHRRQAAI